MSNLDRWHIDMARADSETRAILRSMTREYDAVRIALALAIFYLTRS